MTTRPPILAQTTAAAAVIIDGYVSRLPAPSAVFTTADATSLEFADLADLNVWAAFWSGEVEQHSSGSLVWHAANLTVAGYRVRCRTQMVAAVAS